MKIDTTSNFVLHLSVQCDCHKSTTHHTMRGPLTSQERQTFTCPRCGQIYTLVPSISVEIAKAPD